MPSAKTVAQKPSGNFKPPSFFGQVFCGSALSTDKHRIGNNPSMGMTDRKRAYACAGRNGNLLRTYGTKPPAIVVTIAVVKRFQVSTIISAQRIAYGHAVQLPGETVRRSLLHKGNMIGRFSTASACRPRSLVGGARPARFRNGDKPDGTLMCNIFACKLPGMLLFSTNLVGRDR